MSKPAFPDQRQAVGSPDTRSFAGAQPVRQLLDLRFVGRCPQRREAAVQPQRHAAGRDIILKIGPVADKAAGDVRFAGDHRDQPVVNVAHTHRFFQRIGFDPGFKLEGEHLGEQLAGGPQARRQLPGLVMVAGEQPPQLVAPHDRDRHGRPNIHVRQIFQMKRRDAAERAMGQVHRFAGQGAMRGTSGAGLVARVGYQPSQLRR